MKALYRNRLCSVVEAGEEITLVDDGPEFRVSFRDPDLVIDPTDSQVADVDNLTQWSGIKGQAANDLRAMLRGEMSTAAWESRRRG